MTAIEVATWMATEVRAKKELYQDEAVDGIERKFGSSFIYENSNGNQAISKAVLEQFRQLTESDVVWDRRHRYWRLRESGDESSRIQ